MRSTKTDLYKPLLLAEVVFVECALEFGKSGITWPNRQWSFGIRSPAIIVVLALWETACEWHEKPQQRHVVEHLHRALHGHPYDDDWLADECGVVNGFQSMTGGLILALARASPKLITIVEGEAFFRIAEQDDLETHPGIEGKVANIFISEVRSRFKKLLELSEQEILERTYAWSKVTHSRAAA